MKIGSQTRKVVKMKKKVKEKRLLACLLCQCSGCTSKILVSYTPPPLPFHRKSSLNSVTIEKIAGHIVQNDKCCCISVQEKLPADKQMNMKELAVVDPALIYQDVFTQPTAFHL